LDLRIKSYGCLKIQGEVWAGRACAAANEKELTTCAKNRGQEEKKIQQKWEQPTGPGVDPRPATNGQDLVAWPRPGPDCWSLAARRPAVAAHRSAVQGRPATSDCSPAMGRRLDQSGCPNFFEIFYLKKMNFWKFGKWARAFGRMGVQRPHFLKLATTPGSGNSSKIHGKWRFHFFPNFLFPKFSSYLDLHIYRWDFCFMKKLIP
jgi:hypothetical protein